MDGFSSRVGGGKRNRQVTYFGVFFAGDARFQTDLFFMLYIYIEQWRLSGMSGLAGNPANRQIARSSGDVGGPRLFFFSIFFNYFHKKLEKI